MAVAATAGTDFSAHAHRPQAGHDVNAASELITVVKSGALFDIKSQQMTFAVDLVVAKHMLVTHARPRHQLPGAHCDRGKRHIQIGNSAAAGLLAVIDVQRQFAALLVKALQVEVADAYAEARFHNHATHWNAVTQCQSRTGEIAVSVAFGCAEATAEFAFAVVVDVTGADVGINKQTTLQAGEAIASPHIKEGEICISLTTRTADGAVAIAEAAACTELFGESLGDTDHQALAVFVAAFGVGGAVGAEVACERSGPQTVLADFQVGAAGEAAAAVYQAFWRSSSFRVAWTATP